MLVLAALGCKPTSNPPEDAQFASEQAIRVAQPAVAESRTLPEPIETEPLVWHWDSSESAALLQFGGGPTLFSVSCDKGARTLKFTRFAAAPHRGRAPLSFTTPKRVASIPAAAVTAEGGFSGTWEAVVPIKELPAAVEAMFREGMRIRIALADTPPLVAPPSENAAKPIELCRGS